MLPTCPACKQSVLDDDATECPSCGANMKTGKGGGSAKPPAAAPSKPAKSAEPAAKSAPFKPAAGKPATPSRKPSRDDDDDDPFSEPDDDPFTAATKQDAANKANAISVSPKMTKTHVVELKCPMCDTLGFVPQNSGGKDVKCSNPACTVPVFMAPKRLGAPAPVVAAPKVARQAPANSKKPLILALLGGVALVAIVGLAVLFWPDSSAGPGQETDFIKLAEEARKKRLAAGLSDPVVKSNGDKTTGKPGDPKSTDPVQPAPPKPALDVAQLLKLMDDYSLEEQLANKKYCRQRAAIGFAVIGDAAGMQGQFQKLDTIEATLQHFKLPAYLTLGWRQLSTGDKAGAAKTADEALAATVRVGKGSRDTQEAVIDLAAFLVALGKSDAAKNLLSEHFVPDASTPLVVATAHARHRRNFDLDQEIPGTIGNPQRAWAEVGVTLILTDGGFSTEARQWAEAVLDVEARTDALLAWADASVRIGIAAHRTIASSDYDPVIEKMSPGGKVQMLARLAMTWAEIGNATEAERLIAAAQTVLKGIAVPPAAQMEGFKEALDWKPPAAVPLRQAVLGAAALGQALVKLKKPEDGWNSFVEALKLARAIAPSPAAVEHWKSKGDELGSDGLRDEVRKLLSLSSRDEAQRKTRDLKNKLDAMQGLALERFHLQVAVLKDAVAAGLATQVWRETRSLSERDDPNELEHYMAGSLPHYLIQRFTADGLTKEVAEVMAKIEGVPLPPEEILELQPLVAAALKSQNLGDAISLYNQRKLAGETEELALRSFSHSAKQPGRAIPTLTLAMTMDTKTHNQSVKWEAVRMVAAFAARQGEFTAARDAIEIQKLKPIEKISGFLGLLEGHAAWQKAQAAPAAVEGEKEAAKTGK